MAKENKIKKNLSKVKEIRMSGWGKFIAVLGTAHVVLTVYAISEDDIDSAIYNAAWAVIDGIMVSNDIKTETKKAKLKEAKEEYQKMRDLENNVVYTM